MSKHSNSRKDSFLQGKKQLDSFYTEQSKWIRFNFKFYSFGEKQGESFEEWQREEILADLNNKLKDYCSKSKVELINDSILELYNKYPSDSEFDLPKVLEGIDVQWARMSITGRRRLIGFFSKNDMDVDNNIFYIVFLDKEHRFAPSKKKHT